VLADDRWKFGSIYNPLDTACGLTWLRRQAYRDPRDALVFRELEAAVIASTGNSLHAAVTDSFARVRPGDRATGWAAAPASGAQLEGGWPANGTASVQSGQNQHARPPVNVEPVGSSLISGLPPRQLACLLWSFAKLECKPTTLLSAAAAEYTEDACNVLPTQVPFPIEN
jgi:hypothetical protein